MKENEKSKNITQDALLKAAYVSIFLSILKSIAFVLTGSMLVLASLLDSIADSFASFLNRYISKISIEEADKEHPFGHGGFEVIASLIQGLILGCFGVSLFIESSRNLWNLGESHIELTQIEFAISIMAFSALSGLVIQFYLNRKIRKLKNKRERSLTLEADHSHYLADFWVNLLGMSGLICVYFTQRQEIDLIFGFLASAALLYTSFPILFKAFKDITHSEAPAEIQQSIVDLVMATDEKILGVHALRSREFGPYLFVDFHIKVPSQMSLIKAHALSDLVEKTIIEEIPKADVNIHIDPDTEPDQTPWRPSYKIQD